jgi:hypothetical protein
MKKNGTGRQCATYGARGAQQFRWANLRERERERPLGRSKRKWDYHFRRDNQEIGWRHGLDLFASG